VGEVLANGSYRKAVAMLVPYHPLEEGSRRAAEFILLRKVCDIRAMEERS